jgi:hypothetical protein
VDNDYDDVALEDELRSIAERLDPVPAPALRVAREGLVWRTIDAELAELVYDSAIAREDSAVVRGVEQPRLLTFRAGAFTIELEVTPSGADCEIFGQLVPPGPATVQIRHRGGMTELAVDDQGSFGPGWLPTGPVSLRFPAPDAPSDIVLVTQWVPV